MKLSVIIPVYNVEKYLNKCLKSVIYPNLSDYEVVIVNDGSTDSSPAIAQTYCQRYPGLCRMITTPNSGAGHARNVGMDAAVGEYIVFLDSDDYLAENALPEMLETAKLHFDVCIFDIISVNSAGLHLSYTNGFDCVGEVSLSSQPGLLFTPPSAWNKLFRRTLFIECGVRFPDHVWYEDIRTIPKLYFTAQKIISVRKPWYFYLQRPGSITNSKNAQRNKEIIAALDDLADYCRSIGQYDKYRNELEFLTLDHQLISATVRVNLIDRRSPLQRELADDLFKKFPNCLENPYVKTLSINRRMVLFMCKHRLYLLLHITMRLNNFVTQKNI